MAIETMMNEAAIENNLKQFLLVLSVSLSVATLPQLFSWFRQIPYTLLLVIVGLGLAFIDVRLVTLSPELILLIFLPPLLFEAAWNLEWSKLKRDLIPISFYAVLGVVISVAGVAFALNKVAGISLAIALLVGASVSATDPVSVIALFRELGVGKRLTILMEGESLFNDGIAVVAFSFLVGFSLGTQEAGVPVLVARFLTFVGIGIGLGSLIGFGISYLTQRFDLPLVEQSLTLVSAYGTYIITEELGGSGVIGVVTMGLILGNFGSRIGMQPSTRLAVTQFWDFLAFFVNSMVFLLIGDQISFGNLQGNLGLIGITVGAMLLTRAIAIYGLGLLSNTLAASEISFPEQTVLWWGGLRGSVSIALALSVPDSLPEREETIAIVFGVVLFTLLVQGLTTKPLLEMLGLLSNQQINQQYFEAIARRVALNRVLNRLSQVVNRPEIQPEFSHQLASRIEEQLNSVQLEINELYHQYPQLQDLTIHQLQGDVLAIEADTYAEFVRVGQLKEVPESILQEIFTDLKEKSISE
ncbi:MAG TPA: sodium:proton antiporter [Cyanobacteria bacterium UBA12227]|nr:sodium:proton antiporter [Cyanobacteria bacterium UBA12227]HAX86021.1 sodium:proton antiporter [Cyanobacteria bacterium UBA11370]HBY78539.1 sodium:proton antiporter [Cyanobacteria bacterium UBA11148]